ncbi:hypothetical protein HPP92_028334 [Vanilla planifolia]|uniref:Uncharacterized protein n=1 Tax=Vanilla planifolia TaxID=51239 RepID=A0A835U3I8_VANPL|nr:hypothetical protein HPP92_028334 [Vanilla planifolia]KAG0447503.1 hypothetical protein HPP92_028309 [Vanilla planifolia]
MAGRYDPFATPDRAGIVNRAWSEVAREGMSIKFGPGQRSVQMSYREVYEPQDDFPIGAYLAK